MTQAKQARYSWVLRSRRTGDYLTPPMSKATKQQSVRPSSRPGTGSKCVRALLDLPIEAMDRQLLTTELGRIGMMEGAA